ncbi:hypothetical protein RFI_02975 [Reticulomyxa filosa]|uniref:Uncharacterized protein n=1 Tax=Reticulomyxa filosa TaxID=46433 RepID=X6P7S5_RETFI|nr:hypothetical protein RFI_02975 [Reticulomyxa filosa]|eukprot:ETO34119.1 hypothetical protein RFI_02975 [Reticulomyxa filosa]
MKKQQSTAPKKKLSFFFGNGTATNNSKENEYDNGNDNGNGNGNGNGNDNGNDAENDGNDGNNENKDDVSSDSLGFEAIENGYDNVSGIVSNYDYNNDQIYTIPYIPTYSDYMYNYYYFHYNCYNNNSEKLEKHNEHQCYQDMSWINHNQSQNKQVNDKCMILVWEFIDTQTQHKVNRKKLSKTPNAEIENTKVCCNLKCKWYDETVFYLFKGHLTSIVYAHNIHTVVVSGITGCIALLDDITGKCYNIFWGHQDAITRMVWDESMNRLITCSFDGCIKLWQINHSKYLSATVPQSLCITIPEA